MPKRACAAIKVFKVMNIALAQINPSIGDLHSNQKKIAAGIQKAKSAQLVIFPEMALTGYPPLDLLKHPPFLKTIKQAVQNIHQGMPNNMTAVFGAPWEHKNTLTNSALVLKKNQPIKAFAKSHLANQDVFNEARYFTPGPTINNIFYINKKRVQILICEDMWQRTLKPPPASDLIICLNASPFTLTKNSMRIQQALQIQKKTKSPFVYVNLTAGEEDLIFDGQSFVITPPGRLIYQAPAFKEDFYILNPFKALNSWAQAKPLKRLKLNKAPPSKIIQALCFGLKEFVQKNGFKKVHLGLSGGVDSALTFCLAVKALGIKNVSAHFLPGPFTSKLSFKAWEVLKKNHKNGWFYEWPITSFYQHALKQWPQVFKTSLAKQNLQARLRMLFLMAWANDHPQSLLLGAANKSELAVGYATLYGDLSAGLLPIGDLFKTEVLNLALLFKTIPSFVLKRAPSAELKKNQKDTDDLIPYSQLDPILKKLIEDGQSPSSLLEKQILQKTAAAEFKRKQSPPILKIKPRGFDRGWLNPMPLKFF